MPDNSNKKPTVKQLVERMDIITENMNMLNDEHKKIAEVLSNAVNSHNILVNQLHGLSEQTAVLQFQGFVAMKYITQLGGTPEKFKELYDSEMNAAKAKSEQPKTPEKSDSGIIV